MCLFISYLSDQVEKSASVCVCYKIRGWFSFRELHEELWMLSSLICFPLPPLCTLVYKSGGSRLNPICGVTHKGRSIPIQTHSFLLRLKSKRGWCWHGDRISRMYEVWNGWSPQTRFAGRSRTEASMGAYWKVTLTSLSWAQPQRSPLASPSSLSSTVFPKLASLDAGPGVSAKAGRSFTELTQGPSAWGWSKQTLLKGHFFRLWLWRPEEAAIIFQGCKCQKKNALSHSFPPCPWSAKRLLTRHFLAK